MVCSDLKRFLSTKLQQQLCNQIKTSVNLKKLSELLVICKSQRQNPFLSWRREKKSTMIIIIIIIIIPESFWLMVLLNLAYELLYCTSFNEKNNIFFCYKKPLMTPFQNDPFSCLGLNCYCERELARLRWIALFT